MNTVISYFCKEQIIYSNLPLAVYVEMAAHLRQVSGVETQLIAPECDRFDYAQSQIGYLELSYPEPLPPNDRQHLEEILAFYGNRYGIPERKPLE